MSETENEKVKAETKADTISVTREDAPSIAYDRETLLLLKKYEDNEKQTGGFGLANILKGSLKGIFYVASKAKDSAVDLWHGKEPLKNLAILGAIALGIAGTVLLFPILKFGFAAVGIGAAIHDTAIGVAYGIAKSADMLTGAINKAKTRGTAGTDFLGVQQPKRFEVTSLECDRLGIGKASRAREALTYLRTKLNVEIQTLELAIKKKKRIPITKYTSDRANPWLKRRWLGIVEWVGFDRYTKWVSKRYGIGADPTVPFMNSNSDSGSSNPDSDANYATTSIEGCKTKLSEYRRISDNINKGYLSEVINAQLASVGGEEIINQQVKADINEGEDSNPVIRSTSSSSKLLDMLRRIPLASSGRIRLSEVPISETPNKKKPSSAQEELSPAAPTENDNTSSNTSTVSPRR